MANSDSQASEEYYSVPTTSERLDIRISASAIEQKYNDALENAIDELGDAQSACGIVDATGQFDDIKGIVQELQGLLRWSRGNKGWTAENAK